MSKDSRKTIIPFVFFAYIVFIAISVITGVVTFEDQSYEIVPFTGLAQPVHNLLLVFIWPLVMSIIMVIIFPRIFVVLFLKIKQLLWKDYENAFIEFEPKILTWRKFLKRMFLGFLLVMGLEASLAPLIDPFLFFTASEEQELVEVGLAASPELVRYFMAYFGVLAMVLVPFAVGLWSIGWILEDSGLIHFNIPESKDKFQEVEPIHFRYNTYLGGFAGLSAIFYYAGAVYAYLTVVGYWAGDIYWSLTFSIVLIVVMGPSYIVYWKLAPKFLLKGLKEVKRISKSDILKT